LRPGAFRRGPGSPAETRLAEAGRLLSGREKAEAGDAVAWTAETAWDLGIRPLSAFGVTRADIPVLIEKAGRSSSMKGNPVALTEVEMTRILEEAIG
ncbi:MAG TPA: iron-containing alcohol dehydrogenase, partial [bacterium]|nr:iron-containing alcohol dehydrogenase [bacterium]